MIGWIEGRLRERRATRVVLDVGGVGYELQVPLSTYTALPDEGKTVSLHVHTSVREDAIQLFGFATELEREVFELLLRASRVGPRLAQGMLSGMAAEALLAAIVVGDVKSLRRVPGLGPKMAERIAVELRDRAVELQAAVPAIPSAPLSHEDAASVVRTEALSALVNLGTPRARAERSIEAAAAELGEEAPVEALIRAALRSLGS